jgi:hypothetical protein
MVAAHAIPLATNIAMATEATTNIVFLMYPPYPSLRVVRRKKGGRTPPLLRNR